MATSKSNVLNILRAKYSKQRFYDMGGGGGTVVSCRGRASEPQIPPQAEALVGDDKHRRQGTAGPSSG